MDISISGRKMKVGEALTEHATDRLDAIAQKYFARSIDSTVTFVKEAHLIRTEIRMHPNQGVNLQANNQETDPYASFEAAAEKIEKQLRRYKRRLKNHHAHDHAERLPYMVLAAEKEALPTEAATEVPEPAAEPIIVAESHKEILRVSVSDAVMLMDLEDAGAFMFRNIKTNRLEVIYRRSDGNIGWLSPEQDASADNVPHAAE